MKGLKLGSFIKGGGEFVLLEVSRIKGPHLLRGSRCHTGWDQVKRGKRMFSYPCVGRGVGVGVPMHVDVRR